ncbi:MAG: hypothetical protein ACRDLF_02535 [Solirubrobacteraceae bacterium]
MLGINHASPALATEAPQCPNEQLRGESNVNPATGQPYDLQLPGCRAYEMVSPAEKGGSSAEGNLGLPVSPSGEAVAFTSQNAFGDAENYQVGALGAAQNPYVARRHLAGWVTTSVLPPAQLMGHPSTEHGVDGDATAELARYTDCGLSENVTNGLAAVNAVCSQQQPDGSWLTSPLFPSTTDNIYSATAVGETLEYEGGSADLSHLIFQSNGGRAAGASFLQEDTSASEGDGLYETSAASGAELHLINVNNEDEEIGPAMGTRMGGIGTSTGEPLPCARLGSEPYSSSSYHAISESGAIVYFTACPENTVGGANEIFARVGGDETVAISNPSPPQCATCSGPATSAAFQGASANGGKAFFTTSQPLVNEDTDSSMDLYEWDFANPAARTIVDLSKGGAGDLTPGVGAEVQGVVRVSSDGSHVYFVARGILTALPNAFGETAQEGADNLFGVNTANGEIKFIAELCSGVGTSGSAADNECFGSDEELWGDDGGRRAQATPDGNFLVFATYARLITAGAEAATNEAQQVYRYDFNTGTLIRVSIGEPEYPASNNGNVAEQGSTVASLPFGGLLGKNGALADADDYGRAISSNGAYIVFATAAPLQANDTNTGAHPSCSPTAEATGCDVYLWRECPNGACQDDMAGEVAMVTPGDDPTSADDDDGRAAISSAGGDLFFFTTARLDGQDEDELADLYDARTEGGFPAPTPEPSCSGEECQGTPSAGPDALRAGGSSTAVASGNLAAPAFVELAESTGPVLKIIARSSKSFSVSTPAAGKLVLTGNGLAGTKRTASKAGTYNLALRLTSAEGRLLTKRGRVTLAVTVRFIPNSGKASTATAKITIRSTSSKAKKSKSKT